MVDLEITLSGRHKGIQWAVYGNGTDDLFMARLPENSSWKGKNYIREIAGLGGGVMTSMDDWVGVRKSSVPAGVEATPKQICEALCNMISKAN